MRLSAAVFVFSSMLVGQPRFTFEQLGLERTPIPKEQQDELRRVLETKEYSVSHDALAKLAARYPKSAAVHSVFGRVAFSARQYKDTVVELNSAAKLQPLLE